MVFKQHNMPLSLLFRSKNTSNRRFSKSFFGIRGTGFQMHCAYGNKSYYWDLVALSDFKTQLVLYED